MDLSTLGPTDLDGHVIDRLLEGVDDPALIAMVSDVLARPRTVESSFTLHAPLELLARVRLLPRVGAQARRRARLRMVALAVGYAGAGQTVPAPSGAPPASTDEAVDLLRVALAANDPTLADRAAIGLGHHAGPATLTARLATDLVPLLGAAGHAPILLANWPLVERPDGLNGAIIRQLFRSLAAESGLRFRFDHPHGARQPGSVDDLDAALAAVQPVGDPGFGIFLLMEQAERHQALAAIVAVDADDTTAAFRLILRRAATAMVTDNPDHAPYGWSHALTMPLALAQIAPHTADPTVALDAALTQWCAFRMGHGVGPVAAYHPEPVDQSLPDALATSPSAAAAVAFHDADRDAVDQVLADNAATSHDAHLVKYTVASLDAAQVDPDHRGLYQAAAAFLAGWWRRTPAADDPLAGAS